MSFSETGNGLAIIYKKKNIKKYLYIHFCILGGSRVRGRSQTIFEKVKKLKKNYKHSGTKTVL